MSLQMQYAEPLPPQCPPSDAEERAYEEVFRLVPNNPPGPSDFLSHAALGKVVKGKIDPCRLASCSLVLDPVKHITRWPRLRDENPFAARLTVPTGAGKMKSKGDPNHLDFWCYSHFSMHSAVVDVIDLPEVDHDGP